MMNTKLSPLALLLTLSSVASPTFAKSDTIEDMSDPLAVYTQLGVGFTNHGLNLKMGQTYDTGSKSTTGMNVIELKGIAGEQFGWSGNSSRDDSIDSFRWRNFSADMTTGRGKQIDFSYNVEANPLVSESSADISYSFIQALPKMGPINLYPLIGVGASVGNNATEDDKSIDSGYSLMGTFAVAGMYTKLELTDQIWLNYNPFWLTTFSGSDNYKDNYYGLDQSHILTHEFALSYQVIPRFNIRYFANWTENTNFEDGQHRIEFNYQL